MARKRLISFVSALALVLSLFTLLPEGVLKASAEDSVSICIMGQYLTPSKPSVTIGNGTAKFNYDTNTLFLKGTFEADEEDTFANMIDIRGNNLTIKADGNVKLLGDMIENGMSITGSNNRIYTNTYLMKISAREDGIIFNGSLEIIYSNLDIDANACFDNYGYYSSSTSDSYISLNYTNAHLKGYTNVVRNFDTSSLLVLGESFSVSRLGIFEDGELGNADTGEPLYELTATSQVKQFNLWIKNKQVTSNDNLAFLCDAALSFDPLHNLLYIDENITYTGAETLIKSMIDGLKIVTKHPRHIETQSDVFELYNNATFECPEGLYINSNNGCGIRSAGGYVTIKDSFMEINAKQGITGQLFGSTYMGNIEFNNSDVMIDGSEFAVANLSSGEGSKSIFIKNCSATCPMNADARQGQIYDNIAKKLATYVEIMREGNYYLIYVNGYCVNKYNKNNILYDFRSGKSAKYDPDTNTLTFEKDIDCSDSTYPVLYNGVEGLKVNASVPVKLTSAESQNAIYADKSMTFTGDNKITVEAPKAIAVMLQKVADLTVNDVEFNINAYIGIMSNGTENNITFDGASANISTTGSAVYKISGNIELKNCNYLTPEDTYVYTEGGKNYLVSKSLGAVVKELVIGKKTQIRGDVNGDGSVSLLDVVFLSRAVSGVESFKQYLIPANSFDGNDEVSRLDVVLLSRRVSKGSWN